MATPTVMTIHQYVNLEKLPFVRQDPSNPPRYNLTLEDNYEKRFERWMKGREKNKEKKGEGGQEDREVEEPLLVNGNGNGNGLMALDIGHSDSESSLSSHLEVSLPCQPLDISSFAFIELW